MVWEYHSTYRGIDIEIWRPEGTPYSALFGGLWHYEDTLAAIKAVIDDFLEPEPEGWVFIETYRGFEIWLWQIMDEAYGYYFNVEGTFWGPYFNLERCRVAVDEFLGPGPPICDPFPWYSDPEGPYDGAIPVWIETYRDWNIWDLTEVQPGAHTYGASDPDCVGKNRFSSTLTGIRNLIDGWIVEPEPPNLSMGTPSWPSSPQPAGAYLPVTLRNIYNSGGLGTDCLARLVDELDGSVLDGVTFPMDTGELIDSLVLHFAMPNRTLGLVAVVGYDAVYTDQKSTVIQLEEAPVGIPTMLTLSVPDRAGVGEIFMVTGILHSIDAATVLYSAGDARSAGLLANKYSYALNQVSPSDPPGPILEEENIVVIGGRYANPYTAYYFPGRDPCAASPPYLIETLTRGNGTTVTMINGCTEGDTWEATNIYAPPAVAPIPDQPINISYNGKALGSATTRVDGDYTTEVSVPESGVWTLRSEFPGSPGYAASRSVADTIVAASPLEAAIKIAGSAAVGLALIIYSQS